MGGRLLDGGYLAFAPLRKNSQTRRLDELTRDQDLCYVNKVMNS